jgi:hypothetical protein
MVLPSFFPAQLTLWNCGSGKGEEPSGEEAVLRLIQIRLTVSSLEKIWLACQTNSPQRRIADSSSTKAANLSIRVHNKTLSIVAMRVSNPDCSPVAIQGRKTAPWLSVFYLPLSAGSRKAFWAYWSDMFDAI